MRRVRETFTGAPNEFATTCEVFKRQGGEAELELILQHMQELKDSYLCSAAAGRILTRDEISGETLSRLLSAAFDSESAMVRRNLLYGMYRSPLNRPEDIGDKQSYVVERWIELGIGIEPMTDQYMIGILGSFGADLFLDQMSSIKEISDQQLIIELARAIDLTENSVDNYQSVIMELLSHNNPTVVSEMLEETENG